MSRIQSVRASAPLRRFVRGFAQRTYESGTLNDEPLLPSIEPVMSFLFSGSLQATFADGSRATPSGATLVGALMGLGSLHLGGAIDMFGVFFRAAGFFELFGVPISDVADAYAEVADLIPNGASLTDSLAGSPSFAARVGIAEAFLLLRVPQAARSMEGDAATLIATRQGIVRIDALALAHGLGVRQFERRFAAAIGATPKRFARVARFQAALDAKLGAPHRTWCDVAHASGYHDQMHLVHEFRHLTGCSPRHLVATLGDARPLAGFAPPRAGR